MNCLSCEKLYSRRCGKHVCIKDSSSCQYRKIKDSRCTEEHKNVEIEIDTYIYKFNGYYYVKDKPNNIFIGKYRDLQKAAKERDNYVRRFLEY